MLISLALYLLVQSLTVLVFEKVIGFTSDEFPVLDEFSVSNTISANVLSARYRRFKTRPTTFVTLDVVLW